MLFIKYAHHKIIVFNVCHSAPNGGCWWVYDSVREVPSFPSFSIPYLLFLLLFIDLLTQIQCSKKSSYISTEQKG